MTSLTINSRYDGVVTLDHVTILKLHHGAEAEAKNFARLTPNHEAFITDGNDTYVLMHDSMLGRDELSKIGRYAKLAAGNAIANRELGIDYVDRGFATAETIPSSSNGFLKIGGLAVAGGILGSYVGPLGIVLGMGAGAYSGLKWAISSFENGANTLYQANMEMMKVYGQVIN